MKQNTYIETKRSIMGGVPVIAGTRIPVSRLLYLLSQGYSFKDIREEYPQLTNRTISGVIGFIAEQADQNKFYTPSP